tara:strand:- start:393 stop:1166 length:774 start_codon:yes stop_codon:yes gene_type:complete
MKIKFEKYESGGNDFVLIDNRNKLYDLNSDKIKKICTRNFGVGSDGLIILKNSKIADFKMIYYNSDGQSSSLCGNGTRCLFSFTLSLGIIEKTAKIETSEGIYIATISNRNLVSLKMKNIDDVFLFDNKAYLNSGSPHHIEMIEDLNKISVKKLGSSIRFSSRYSPNGTNVNFFNKINDEKFEIRTYERGVEDETLSCGTGATAVAIAVHAMGLTTKSEITIQTRGGELIISFEVSETGYKNICLEGPTRFVFKGVY